MGKNTHLFSSRKEGGCRSLRHSHLRMKQFPKCQSPRYFPRFDPEQNLRTCWQRHSTLIRNSSDFWGFLASGINTEPAWMALSKVFKTSSITPCSDTSRWANRRCDRIKKRIRNELGMKKWEVYEIPWGYRKSMQI